MRLHIGNVPKTLSDQEFKDLVTPFGDATAIEVVKDSNGTSRGYGFADFAEAEQAKAAITGLDGKEIGGQTIKVAEARPRKVDGAKQTARPPQA